GVGELRRRLLHAQIELLAQHVGELLAARLGVHRPVFFRFRFHGHLRYSVRVTIMVRTGSFAAASLNASRASASLTPSISYSTAPGLISDTQYSTLPLPL